MLSPNFENVGLKYFDSHYNTPILGTSLSLSQLSWVLNTKQWLLCSPSSLVYNNVTECKRRGKAEEKAVGNQRCKWAILENLHVTEFLLVYITEGTAQSWAEKLSQFVSIRYWNILFKTQRSSTGLAINTAFYNILAYSYFRWFHNFKKKKNAKNPTDVCIWGSQTQDPG